MNCTQIKNSSLEPQNGKLAIKHFQVENKKSKIKNDYSKCHYNLRKIENIFFLKSVISVISGFLPDMFNHSCNISKISVVNSFD